MQGLNVIERLKDISSISGLSEDIVRRVLDAERQSIIKSLKRGERATLIGRCSVKPEIKQRLDLTDLKDDQLGMVGTVKLAACVAPSLAVELAKMTEFEKSSLTDTEAFVDEDFRIRTRQIEALE